MLEFKRGFSTDSDSKAAAQSVISNVMQNDVKFVIFFASSKYDFELVSKEMKNAFADAEVIGCTTAGEIGPNGITESSLVAMSIAADDFVVSTAIVKDIKTKAMFSKGEIVKAFNNAGLDLNDSSVNEKGFGIVLIDGLQAAEEKVLSVLNMAVNDFPIVGGSAGDDLQFKQTLVSANGVVYDNAAVVSFVKTNKKFITYKENIYEATDKELKVTKADANARTVYELDNKPAMEAYAQAIGVSKEEAEKQFMRYPLGRQFSDNIMITSPYAAEGDAMKFYAQLMEGAVVKLLKPMDPVAQAKITVEDIKAKIPNVKGVIAFNCILRYLQFKAENRCNPVYTELAKSGEIIGFSTYGEQYYKHQVNQTLTLVALGE